MCLYGKTIQNRKYVSNQKNGGVIPAINDIRALHTVVGCGNCMECRKQKARSWQVRLIEDIKTNTNGKFVTLTFSNQSIQQLVTEIRQGKPEHIYTIKSGKNKGKQILVPEVLPYLNTGYSLDNKIAKLALRRFNERYRKIYKKAIRHFMVTELGHNGTENIHMHGILFTDIHPQEIQKIWSYGYIWPRLPYQPKNPWSKQYVNSQTVNYIIKYIIKRDQKHKTYKSIVLTSPGIGSNYIQTIQSKLNIYNGINTNETYKSPNGYKIALPTYWRNKIYTEEQREKLWMQKLDQPYSYICGEKINISKTEKDYNALLEHYRQINTQLGFGSDKINWKRQQYEHEVRTLKIMARIQYNRQYTTA
jgi:hypothetical protein